jgi:tRNA(fMet)-specific endonuclease VapC
MLRTKEPPQLILRLAELARSDVHISTPTVREVLFGLRRKPGLEELEDRFERFLDRYEILPFDLMAARVCANLAAGLEAQGKRLDLSDLEIAAIALANNLALVTGNDRHFRRVPGLRAYNWLQ